MRAHRTALLAVAAVAVLGAAPALAVSGGGYHPHKQGCKGNADNSKDPKRVEKNCRSLMYSISDAKHTYVSVGVPQVKDGSNPVSGVIVCLDLGTGTRQCTLLSQSGAKNLKPSKGTKVHPQSGLRSYFGADDNLDSGEHDGSSYISNGPSDGGAINAGVRTATAKAWLKSVLAMNSKSLLHHPLPLGDAGFGACADGLCFSLQTQRRVAYRGGNKHKHRDVANYGGVTWDPESCAGPSDGKKDCGGHTIAYWHERNGTTYVEPGLQIYEDPDPQGSPLADYPIPALYVGSCGVIVGGGKFGDTKVKAPKSPWTNSAGQLVVSTGC
jgi:hypothetical protein